MVLTATPASLVWAYSSKAGQHNVHGSVYSSLWNIAPLREASMPAAGKAGPTLLIPIRHPLIHIWCDAGT
jgi:hypothetical protein